MVSNLATELEAKERTKMQILKDDGDVMSVELADSVSVVKSKLQESESLKRYLTVVDMQCLSAMQCIVLLLFVHWPIVFTYLFYYVDMRDASHTAVLTGNTISQHYYGF